jgi:HEPN domain-containing protein
MPVVKPTQVVAREWVLKAEGDLKAAAHLLQLGIDAPTEAVCFHAQQCVEKYLKALLILAEADFPKTHDLDRLVQLLRRGTDIGLNPAERAELTTHAVAARYPGAGEIPLPDARRSLRLARRARKTIRGLMPLAVKRTTKRRA